MVRKVSSENLRDELRAQMPRFPSNVPIRDGQLRQQPLLVERGLPAIERNIINSGAYISTGLGINSRKCKPAEMSLFPFRKKKFFDVANCLLFHSVSFYRSASLKR
jgi:hypothetical protein